MNETLVWLGIFVWVVFGIMSYGRLLAYWQGHYPNVSKMTYMDDVKAALLLSVFGPITYAIIRMGRSYKRMKQYGYRFV